VSAIRLFVLGTLARQGPLHGHGIRRAAQIDRTELWADVKPGSLYGALGRMAEDGLIEAVCTQREGNLPERTVYGITESGRAELRRLQLAVIADARFRPDPVDLALAFSDDVPRSVLREHVERRRRDFAEKLAFFRELSERAQPHLEGLEPLMFRHTFARLEAEIAFHDELLEHLAKGQA